MFKNRKQKAENITAHIRLSLLFHKMEKNYLLVYLVCTSKYGVNDHSTFILLPAFIPPSATHL